MNKKILVLGLLFGLIVLVACTKNDEKPGIANPASVYCQEQGGTIKIVETEAGQQGICVLKDGTECDEWAFFRNECSPDSNSETSLRYQPMQCQQTPWQKWYEEGNINFVKEPTEKELAVAYFSNKYEVEILNFEKVETNLVVCEACDICQTTFYYEIELTEEDAEKLRAEGWN